MKANILETTVGFAVIVVACVFLLFAYHTVNQGDGKDSYLIKARFQNIEGVGAKSDIMLSGIKIGFVEKLTLDHDNYMAVLDLRINKDVKLPKDTRVAVSTSGLLGNKYIAVIPGGAEEQLAANEVINNTQSTINLEELISKVIYSLTNK